MNIVLVGAGEVGFNLSKVLSKEGYNLTIIDIDPNKCNRVNNNLDAKVIEGNGASQRILQKINLEDVKYFLALTKIDEINLVASSIAKKLGAKKVITRLRNTEYVHKRAVMKPEDFGIDYVIYPEKAAKSEIFNLIKETSAVEIKGFKNDKVKLIGVKLEHSSPLIGRTVNNVQLSNPYLEHQVAVIDRDDHTFIPHKETIYNKEDVVYFVVDDINIDLIQKMAGKPPFKVNNIMILGLGKLGRLLAKSLQVDYNVKILETNAEKAKKYSSDLDECLILIGDGLDLELLESENIFENDCFIAATENQETNMLASMIAKNYNVKQVIMHINSSSYLKSIRRIGVDAIVSKSISAVNKILNILESDKEEIQISRFEDIDIDVLEIKALPDCKYFIKNYQISDIPESICLGALIRDDEIIIPSYNTTININDDLVLFVKPENISKAENLFQ